MRPLRVIGFVLWLTVFAVGGWFVAREMRAPAPAGTVPADNAAAAAPPAVATRPVPEFLPDIRLNDLEGRSRALSEWRGRTLLINFWATWCAPCRREMPLLEEFQRTHDAREVQVIGIAIDRLEPALQFLGETGVTYPNLVGQLDATRAAEGFGDAYQALPFSVVVAPDGRILATHTGELTVDFLKQLGTVAAGIAGGQIGLPAARAGLERALTRPATGSGTPNR